MTCVCWLIAGTVTVSIIVTGGWYGGIVYSLGASWIAWLLLWRPSVVCFTDRVSFRNVLRDADIPYAIIDDVDTRFTLAVTARGRRYSAWGAPAPGKVQAMKIRKGDENLLHLPLDIKQHGVARPGDLISTASGAPALVIRRALAEREGSNEQTDVGAVVTKWSPFLVVTTIVVAIAAVIAAIV